MLNTALAISSCLFPTFVRTVLYDLIHLRQLKSIEHAEVYPYIIARTPTPAAAAVVEALSHLLGQSS